MTKADDAAAKPLDEDGDFIPPIPAKFSPHGRGRANERQVGGDHYRQADGGEQHWDRMWRLWGPAWFVGNITKYVERYRSAHGLKDLEKARHYLDKLIELESGDVLPGQNGKAAGCKDAPARDTPVSGPRSPRVDLGLASKEEE
jgi:hypothetical protein